MENLEEVTRTEKQLDELIEEFKQTIKEKIKIENASRPVEKIIALLDLRLWAIESLINEDLEKVFSPGKKRRIALN